MKNIILIIGIAAGITFVSCKESATKNDTDHTPATSKVEDDIVKGSVTNNDGLTLDYEFNNTQSTAVLTIDGKRIHMKQDTTASGIQYSNDDYKYVEHQGAITLSKNDQVIFENQ